MTSRITSVFGPHSTAREVAKGRDLTGRTAIVTGGASGIGLETVRALAEIGARLVVGVRDVEAAKRALSSIEGNIEVAKLDLADLDSVRAFASAWQGQPLHLLINNAGIMNVPLARTREGIESHLGVNHLGHFLLTDLLADALRRGAPSRVVTLSSSAHRLSPFEFDDPNFERRSYDPMLAYGQSKTANALFAVEHDRRSRSFGVRSFALMPGIIRTRLMRHVPEDALDALEQRMAHAVKNPEQGASTSVWAALAPELDGQGGLYLEDCAQAERADANGVPGRGVTAHALDPGAAAELWRWSAQHVGL